MSMQMEFEIVHKKIEAVNISVFATFSILLSQIKVTETGERQGS